MAGGRSEGREDVKNAATLGCGSFIHEMPDGSGRLLAVTSSKDRPFQEEWNLLALDAIREVQGIIASWDKLQVSRGVG